MLLLEAPPPAAAEIDPPSPSSAPDAPQPKSPVRRKRRIPSQRNRRVFELVVLCQRPQEEVAREFKVSQQRVSQIVEHFQAWLAENLPAGAERLTADEQLRLGASTAYLRQEYLYARAIRDARASWRDKFTERTRYSASGQVLWTETLQHNQSGNSGYLNVAIRASLNSLKIVQMAGGYLSRAMEIEPWLEEEPPASANSQGSTGGAEGAKGLWDSGSPAGPMKSAAADSSTATCSPAEDCSNHAGHRPAEQPPHEDRAKSCETRVAEVASATSKSQNAAHPQTNSHQDCGMDGNKAERDSRQVLWNPDSGTDARPSAATAAAAASDLRVGTCTGSDQRPAESHLPRTAGENSCADPVSAMLVAFENRRAEGAGLPSPDERRRARKERQKQLVRWQAARQARAG